jgi:hypothetical protein
MSPDDPLIDLLQEWERQRRQGREPTPEELCPDDEGLRETLRRLLPSLKALDVELGLESETIDHPYAPSPVTPTRLGPYALEAWLGRGGFGTVYRATHTLLGRQVALKVLHEEFAGQPHYRTRFLREMKAVGRLDHPHIVRATDADCHEGMLYLAMELLDGIDLERLTRERAAPLPLPDACEIVRQAAAGLQHAHQHGLVHRDIKPGNLMLTRSGTVKLLDLGLALSPEKTSDGDPVTVTGQFMGTPTYAAPEQHRDAHAADARSDIYALGATLIHLLTGAIPPAPRRPGTPARGPAEGLGDGIPAKLAAILRRMTAHRPEDRFQNCAEVEGALQRFTRGHDLAALAAGDTGSAGRMRVGTRSVKARVFTGLGLAGAAVALIGGAMALKGRLANPGTAPPGGESVLHASEKGIRSNPPSLPPGVKPAVVREWKEPDSTPKATGTGRRFIKDQRYVMEANRVGSGWYSPNFGDYADGMLEAVARIAPESQGGRWSLNLFNFKAVSGTRIDVFADGRIVIGPPRSNQTDDPTAGPDAFQTRHPSVKPQGEWNRLRVVMEGRAFWVYINDSPVGERFVLARPFTPGVWCLGVGGQDRPGTARAEFTSVAFWPLSSLRHGK